MSQVAKRVVLVTGAGRGFGAKLVSEFADAGYLVVATARQVSVNEERPFVLWKQLDVTNHENCSEVIDHVASQVGRIDVLVNNASAYSAGKSLHELSPEAIAQELDVTLRGAIFVSRAYVSRLRDQGHGTLIFISSTAGRSNEPECGMASVYSAAKAGLIRFAETLQDDVVRFGIRTQVVLPGNMRDCDDDGQLMADSSVSYTAAARAVVALADDSGNLRPTHVEFRPARQAGRQE